MATQIFLSVVIPAYNEEKRIFITLNKIVKYFDAKSYSYEIIVVNDGSNDNTIEVVNKFIDQCKGIKLLQNGTNKGKGYSIKKGILHATGEFVLFSDADLSTPIEETDKLFAWFDKGYDLVIGSRALKESDIQVHQPWFREIMGKVFNVFVRLITIKGIKDTQCGFKCFKKTVIPDVFGKQTIDRFGFDVELLWIANKQGYNIKEIPIQWFNEPNSKVSPLSDSLQMFFDLVKIRINDMLRIYN